ncbi:unnamed protein product [Brassica oleracea]
MIRLFSHVIQSTLMLATVMSTVSTPSGTTVSRRVLCSLLADSRTSQPSHHLSL